MTTKEIVTLQFGNYSNYIGTNWWNIQESGFVYDPTGPPSDINHDILFREGLTFKGNVTFTPRLLLVDLKGCLNHTELCVPDEAPIIEETENEWGSGVVKVSDAAIEQAIQKNASQSNQSAGQTVSLPNWSDSVHTKYHSRTGNVINEYQHGNEAAPFDIFPLGKSLWQSEQFEEDFTDKIRNYVEECDNFQGFHVLLDSVNAFSGLSTSCVEYLKDEYSSKSIVAFPVFPSHTGGSSHSDASIKMGIKLLNLLLCFDSLAENSSLFVPLSTGSKEFRHEGPSRTFHHTQYNAALPFHSSAILASALDTFTLKYRAKNSEYSLVDLTADLNTYGRKVSAASLCFPFSVNRDETIIDALDKWQGPLSKSITPNCELDTDKMMQLYTLRGLPEGRLKLPSGKAGKQLDMPAYKCNTIKEMLSYYVACTSYASATDVTVVHNPLPIRQPFPKIFDSNVDRLGNIDTFLKAPADVESVPLLAGLHNGKCVGDMLEVLNNDVKRVNFKRFHQYHNGGIDQEVFSDCLNRMMSLRECYEENYEF